jgi:hypothetical protein
LKTRIVKIAGPFTAKLSKTVLQAGEKKKFSFRRGEGIEQLCLMRLYMNRTLKSTIKHRYLQATGRLLHEER